MLRAKRSQHHDSGLHQRLDTPKQFRVDDGHSEIDRATKRRSVSRSPTNCQLLDFDRLCRFGSWLTRGLEGAAPSLRSGRLIDVTLRCTSMVGAFHPMYIYMGCCRRDLGAREGFLESPVVIQDVAAVHKGSNGIKLFPGRIRFCRGTGPRKRAWVRTSNQKVLYWTENRNSARRRNGCNCMKSCWLRRRGV